MNKSRTILIFGFCFYFIGTCFPKIANSQLEADYWMFRYGQYVHFNNASDPDTIRYPSALSSLFYGAGSTSYSDKNGNLLFYGGGGSVFDRNFEVFPSLNVLTGGDILNYIYGEATQPILTIPYPGNDSLYIVFHIWSNPWNNYKSQLCYSIINMKLRNGLGEIDPAHRNVTLLGGEEIGFKLTAVLHCNKKDIWVVGHLMNSDKYYSFLVTENGISNNPVYFSGSYISTGTNNYYVLNPNHYGCLKVSASGNRLGAAFKGLGIVELMDFNTQTGLGSNLKTLDAVPPDEDTVVIPRYQNGYGPWGLDFSPSGDKLYVTGTYNFRHYTTYDWGTYLYQFDVSLPTVTQMQDSRFKIDVVEGMLGGAIQIANNGKMYVNVQNDLSEIAYPENLGMACNYTRLKVMSGVQYADRNLPTYLQSYFRYPMITTGNCQFQNISFSVQNVSGVSNMEWDFGDPASGANNTSSSFNPTHIFSKEGAYEVKVVMYNSSGCGADTIRKMIHAGPFKVFLGNDTTLCAGDTLLLKMDIPNGNNLWNNNSRDTVIKITQAGKYWVRVNIGECFTTDTIEVSVQQLPVFYLGNDTTICSNQSLILSAKFGTQNVDYGWSTGAMTPSITINSAGSYWVKVQDNLGCTSKDTINVQFKSLPAYSLGVDTSLCEGQKIALDATVNGAATYQWSNNNSSPVIQPTGSGIYWADVTKDNCTYRDSIAVIFKPLPVVNLGMDTTICEGLTLLLDAKNIGAVYSWQNKSSDQTYLVAAPGQYFSKITMDGCSSSDTIQVNYDLKPAFSLGADFGICQGQSIALTPEIKNSSSAVDYRWQNGSSLPSFIVTQPGTYELAVSNYCGLVTDTLVVTKGVCKLYIPTAFSPNGDGLNDVFKAAYGENISSFNLEIYNRRGQRIFQSSEINRGWDGMFNGKVQPHSAYIWTIRYKEHNNVEKFLKGTIMLIR